MDEAKENVFLNLDRLFHEPSRLAIVTTLAEAEDRVRFPELRDVCGMTDGNLSRHLSSLEEAGIVDVDKSFVGAKPCTTLGLTDEGRERFVGYLSSLANVLVRATDAIEKG